MRRASWVLLAFCVSCRCGGAKLDTPEARVLRLVPATASSALVLPHLGTGTRDLGALVDALARIPGGEAVTRAVTDLTLVLRADPRTPEGLEAMGLDASAAAAVWTVEGAGPRQVVLALPAKKLEVLADRLGEVAVQAGAQAPAKGPLNGVRELKDTSGRMVAALTGRDGFLLVALGDRRPLEPVTAPLSERSEFRQLRSRLQIADLVGWTQLHPDSEGGWPVVVGAQVGAKGVKLQWLTALSGGVALVAGQLGGRASFVPLPESAPLTLELGGNPAAWATLTKSRWPGVVTEAMSRAGVNLDQDVFGNLEPGISLALSLQDAPDFSKPLSYDPRDVNPFWWVKLRAFGQVRDPKRAAETLEKLAKLGSVGVVQLGWNGAAPAAGPKVLAAHYPLGESVSVALSGKTVVVTGGVGEMGRALAELKGPVGEDAAALKLQLSPQKLVTELQQLPVTLFGGLAGLTVRSMIVRLAEPASHFGTLALDFKVDSTNGVLVGDLDVPLR